ncbi:hypothetical protein V6N12_056159 [Hibiscus sabdariffa]|uniref:Uncharacterized protein n=1 Tax=Hibiscus sabdariffa TaxID=183260 RepID=A0ABR2CRP5_9ROSI
MERQGNNTDAVGQGGKHEDRRKKSKRAVETEEEGAEVVAAAAECGMQSIVWLPEERQWLRGAAEEEMPWASTWSPLWGVDFVDKAYGALFGDVAWDDDIWGLKTVMAIPQQMQ